MGRESIEKFHRAVADTSPLPYMIYNFPTVTAGIDIDSDIISALAAHPNIIGIKASCGNLGKIQRVITQTSEQGFATFAGKSDVFLHTLLSGGAGVIGALVNVAPKAHAKLYKLFLEYRKTKNAEYLELAFSLQSKISLADWAVSKIGGIGGIKAIISKEFGYGTGAVRGPLREVNLDVVVQGETGSIWWKAVEDILQIERSL